MADPTAADAMPALTSFEDACTTVRPRPARKIMSKRRLKVIEKEKRNRALGLVNTYSPPPLQFPTSEMGAG